MQILMYREWLHRNEDLPCYANPYTATTPALTKMTSLPLTVTLGKVILPHETESFEGERSCAGFQVHEGLPAPIKTIESVHKPSSWCLSQKFVIPPKDYASRGFQYSMQNTRITIFEAFESSFVQVVWGRA